MRVVCFNKSYTNYNLWLKLWLVLLSYGIVPSLEEVLLLRERLQSGEDLIFTIEDEVFNRMKRNFEEFEIAYRLL